MTSPQKNDRSSAKLELRSGKNEAIFFYFPGDHRLEGSNLSE